jgi:polyisoprenoid-binding protein YceI
MSVDVEQNLLTSGTWEVDTIHSEIAFRVRHLGLAKVRGVFNSFTVDMAISDDKSASSVDVKVDMASVDTGNSDRDGHLRSADFFDVEKYPTMRFRSTGVEQSGEDYLLRGDLTVRDVTRPIELRFELDGVIMDEDTGGARAGFTAHGELNRHDFGVTFDPPGQNIFIGRKVEIEIQVEATPKSNAESE